ncbi:MAG TPA: hypothetical protein VHA05_03970 [Candidatus Saccharimonadales bacterium]|nr:hypothetical protein [Candidatus Saccharimonadales bacterium]
MDEYDFSKPKTDKWLNRLSDKFEHDGEITSREGNETERSLSGQLILLTTVLITVNMLVIGGDGKVFEHLTHTQKEYVFAALILEIVATIAGVVNYLRIEYYYNEWAGVLYKCAGIVTGREYKNQDELNNLLRTTIDTMKDRKVRLALWTQIAAIVFSLLVYVVLLHSILFYIPSSSKHKSLAPQPIVPGAQKPFVIKPTGYPR